MAMGPPGCLLSVTPSGTEGQLGERTEGSPVVRIVSSRYWASTLGVALAPPLGSSLALPRQLPASISFCILALTQGAACTSRHGTHCCPL